MSPEKQSSPYSFQSFIEFINLNFSVLLFVGLAFLAGFFIGSLWTENELLRQGGTPAATAKLAANAQPVADQAAAPTGPTKDTLAKVPQIGDGDHVRGPENAKITLFEYSDFECPFCKQYHPTVKQIMEAYPNDVKVVYRHYPLSFHPQAQPLAEASECITKLAGEDAFWKFHDYVFEKVTTYTDSTALDAGVAIGINRDALASCLKGNEFEQKIKDQTAGGSAAGVTGTPGTILMTTDGKYDIISGAVPFENAKATIDQYL